MLELHMYFTKTPPTSDSQIKNELTDSINITESVPA